MDLARSIQEITEEVMLQDGAFAHRETGMRDLCLAGGVALNCVGNGRILREGPFEEIWIQPAAGDAGGALGVALSSGIGIWTSRAQRRSGRHVGAPRGGPRGRIAPRYADGMSGSLLGPRSATTRSRDSSTRTATRAPIASRAALAERSPRCWREEKVVGLLQGRMEFGPRALGGRSIIGDARRRRCSR